MARWRGSTGGGAGTRDNPLIGKIAPASPWSLRNFFILGTAVFYGYVVYYVVTKSGGSPLSALTGGDADAALGEVPTTRFTDVKGCDEAKAELEEIVDFLRDPEKYRRLGARVPRGVLLTGPPGTGKTLLARAIAGEAGCRFYAKSGSEFEEMLVGLGARRVRDLFDAARKNTPAIIFIDEIDAMGGKRRVSMTNSSAERQTLNQLLSSMDGFTKHDNVIVIGATNSPNILDPALVRPGRFDTKVEVPPPDVRGRTEILQLYLSRVTASPAISAETLARATPGMTGAQLEALVNTAALLAAQRGAAAVEPGDVEEARDKVIMGPALRSRATTPAELSLVAHHEAGHAVVHFFSRGREDEKLHKITILPRGAAGGANWFLEGDNTMDTRRSLLSRIDVAMGGRVAEEMTYGADGVTSGASSDLEQATAVAHAFVSRFGMSEGGGLASVAQEKPELMSEQRKQQIDAAVEKILAESYKRVSTLLTARAPEYSRLANALLAYETLDAAEARAVVMEGADVRKLREAEAVKEAERKKARDAAGGRKGKGVGVGVVGKKGEKWV